MVDEEENIENKELLLDLMRFKYEAEDKRNNEIDTKISTLIAFLGVILSLQGTLGSFLIKDLNLTNLQMVIVAFLFIISLVFYVKSIFCLMKVYNPQKFASAPNHELIKYYDNHEESKKTIIHETIENMEGVIVDNKDIMGDKAKKIVISLDYFKKGIIFTIIFLVIVIIFRIQWG